MAKQRNKRGVSVNTGIRTATRRSGNGSRRLRIDGRTVQLIPTRRLPAPQGDVGPNAIALPRVDPAVLAPPPASGTPDNLVLAASKNKDIDILWGGFDDAYPDDEITFEFNGAEFDFITVGPTDDPPFIGTLPAELAWARQGPSVLSVYYKGAAGSGERSGNVALTIDTEAPGDPQLGALAFDSADKVGDTGIIAAILRDDGDPEGPYVWAEIPSYTGFQDEDDKVHIVCNGIREPEDDARFFTVKKVNGHLEVRLYKSFLERVGDTPTGRFTYWVTDRAGNVSLESMPVTVGIHVGQIATLEAPTVPAYDDDDDTDPDNPPLIDEADARGVSNQGFQVIIPWNDDYQAGDEFIITLNGVDAGPVAMGPDGDDIVALFPYRGSQEVWSAGSTGGTDQRVSAEVTYTVLRDGASAGTSPPHDVAINLFQSAVDPDPDTPVNERLEAPVVVSADGTRDEIPIGDFGKDATIEIPKRTSNAYPPRTEAFEEGDTLRVHYGTQPSFDFPVPALGDLTEPLPITLPGALIEAQGSGTDIPVWYEVLHELAGGGQNSNLSPTKPIDVRGKDTQPGKGELDAGTFADENAGGFLEEKFHYTSTRFEIPDYENRDATDKVSIHMELHRGPTHQPGDVAYEDHVFERTIDAGTATPIVSLIPSNFYNLYGDSDKGGEHAAHSAYVHIEATYTVTKTTGDTTPVTSEVARVKVDARFSTGPTQPNHTPE